MALACEQSREARQRIAAFHLEGPYISNEDGPRGAHPSAYCRPPDWDEFERFQEAAGGRIGVLTMSPEYDGSARFIERAVSSGVLVAIGHTKATSQQIWEAVDAGARMSTHLGNGSHALIPRHANYVWDQAAEDRLVASLIVDGHHLPPAVVKCLVRAKTPQRCVLISDLVGDAGLPPGRYRNATVGEIEVLDDGRIVIAGQRQYLAGAGLPLAHGVANVMRFAGLDLRTAIEMAAVQPATLLGLEPAGLTPGERADLILFDLPDGPSGPIRVRATVNCGERVFGVIDGV
jgi:N-acetylglucosamine-6-phosphate deacetylase